MKELSARQVRGPVDNDNENKKPDPPSTDDELLVSDSSSSSSHKQEEFVNTGAQKWEEIHYT